MNSFSRRTLLCAFPAAFGARAAEKSSQAEPKAPPATSDAGANSLKGQRLAANVQRYLDAATEFPVYRLTDASYRSVLPLPSCRAISHRGNFLLYSSDRTGSMQVFRLDLKSGESRQLTDAANLDPDSVTLVPDDRSLLLFDGPALKRIQLNNLRERVIHRIPEGAGRGQGFAIAEDGLHLCYVEKSAGLFRLRLVRLSHPAAAAVAESTMPISMPWPRPRRAALLYQRGEESLRLVGYDGAGDRALKISGARVGPALWSAGGRTVLYLSVPSEKGKATSIRENTPGTNEDRLVAPTSQFCSFTRNSDGTMFAGASSNPGAPYVLLLLRLTRRELTLCEHRASDPASVRLLFSPSSQRIYFQSDRDGKMAIYALNVDRFVAATDEDSG